MEESYAGWVDGGRLRSSSRSCRHSLHEGGELAGVATANKKEVFPRNKNPPCPWTKCHVSFRRRDRPPPELRTGRTPGGRIAREVSYQYPRVAAREHTRAPVSRGVAGVRAFARLRASTRARDANGRPPSSEECRNRPLSPDSVDSSSSSSTLFLRLLTTTSSARATTTILAVAGQRRRRRRPRLFRVARARVDPPAGLACVPSRVRGLQLTPRAPSRPPPPPPAGRRDFRSGSVFANQHDHRASPRPSPGGGFGATPAPRGHGNPGRTTENGANTPSKRVPLRAGPGVRAGRVYVLRRAAPRRWVPPSPPPPPSTPSSRRVCRRSSVLRPLTTLPLSSCVSVPPPPPASSSPADFDMGNGDTSRVGASSPPPSWRRLASA